jgi:hypothetical protein
VVEDTPLHFELLLGDAFMALDFDNPDRGSLWVNEVFLSVQAQIGGREGGGWLGFDYAIPLAHGTEQGRVAEQAEFDPPVRLGLEVGGVWSLRRAPWDLFASYSFVDRGELENPTSTLPILMGGFDQRQILFGVQYRFESDQKDQRGHW